MGAEMNMINDAKDEKQHNRKSEIDERGDIPAEQKEILRHIYLGNNTGI